MTPEQGTPSAVETLQAAARLMRERAEIATPGRWKSWGMEVRADTDGTSNLDTSLPVASTYSMNAEGRPRTYDADHIIGMQPAVALAVADWLENVAAWIDEGLGRCDDLYQTNYPDAWNDQREAALTVARAYLFGRSA
jgi:hypothetical protein